MFKYQWVWAKSRALGFTNAKNKPMNKHEDILVFSNGTCANCSPKRMKYYPQGLVPYNKMVKGRKTCPADSIGHKFGRDSHKELYSQEFTNYPTSVLNFPNEGNTIHPTQKPVELCEYLIKSYTLDNEIILDNCSGSGTSLISAINSKRNFIGIENDLKYFELSQKRIDNFKIM